MRGIFGEKNLDENFKLADYLDESAFDEKFEINLAKDHIRNIYHVESKYYVPVHIGSFRTMFAYAEKYMIHPDDMAFQQLFDPDTLDQRIHAPEAGGILKAECREKLIDGSYRWVQYMGITGEEHGVPEGLIYFYVYDIQNQKDRLMGKIPQSTVTSSRNELTGLITKDIFLVHGNKMMREYNGRWCCVAIDIHHFKIFNSWYGHEKGDYILAEIGAALQAFERENHLLAAYFAKDNFAILLQYDLDLIERIYNRLKEIITSYSRIMGFMPVFGIYLFEKDEEFTMEHYDRARVAVEVGKNSYSDRIQYFDSQKYLRKQREYEVLSEFQSALKNHEITFYLQPQCNLSTRKIVGAEALVRWIKPDGRMLSPAEFIPILEEGHFIAELDKKVWDLVCAWLRSVIDRNLRPVPVSVNVSQMDLVSMDVPAYLYALTEHHNIPARLLKVEITESAYAENSQKVREIIDDLRKKGFTVLMDDFGSGYSSLNMLDRINVDVLKLDMEFIRRERSISKRGISIMESIISMAKALSIPVVMEGVENEEQVKFLENLGCCYAQGYYFYKPMPIQSFEELMKEEGSLEYEGFHAKNTELFHMKEFLSENLFADTVLNNILGPVAFYTLEGKDLTINRFNEQFYKAIGDIQMESRCKEIQHYVVKEDWNMLYHALETAESDLANGGECEIRFYKSDNSVFWFYMHFFHLKTEGRKKYFYGQVRDVTESRIQSISFFEVLRQQSEVTMKMNLERNTIQYVTGDNTLYQVDLPSIALDESVRRTAESRIEKEEDQKAFLDFFNIERLKNAYRKAVYHETLCLPFKLQDRFELVEFSSYYIRFGHSRDLNLYVFTKRVN